MIRLTVLYNLANGVDEDEFIAWRRSEKKKYVNAMHGVLRSDFCLVENVSSNNSNPDYRFQTTVDWVDRDTFESQFYSEEAQAKLRSEEENIGNRVFIISELIG